MARSTAMKAAGLILALLIFTFFSLAASSSNNQIQILNAERRIDLSSHIVKVFLTLKVENVGTSPASEIFLAFPPSQADQLALVKAQAAIGKKKKKSYVHLDVNPTQLPDAPNGTKYFSISLLNPLSSGETATLEVLYILTHSLEPFPAEISQLESQLVYFRDSALILSPYHIKQQTTFIKTPSTKVESFTRVEPTKFAGRELKYGPYEDRPPYSFSPVIVHLENNSPFAVVEELLREVEISHWGNLQITEHYKLVHAGARHKGVFSRVDYQSRASVKGASSFKHLLASLPPRVHSVYYRDEIGNISSSHLRTDYRKSELEIEPRYPLFGGWKATFVIGYGLPLEDFLFESPDGKRYLNFSFGCPLAQTVVNKLTIKVVLPEGSKDPSAAVPYPVEQRLETKYSYLDVVGRTVVVLEKKNVVPEHITPFQFLTLICSFRHPWLRRVSALILLNHRKLSRSESEAHQEPFEAACKTFRFSAVAWFIVIINKHVVGQDMMRIGIVMGSLPFGLEDQHHICDYTHMKISPARKEFHNDGKMEGWLYIIRSNWFGLKFLRKRGRLSGFDLLALNVCLTDEIEKPLRSANIDFYIRITDNGRESINRKVFFIFTLYNTLKDNDQLKLGASSSEDAGKWIRSLQTAVVKVKTVNSYFYSLSGDENLTLYYVFQEFGSLKRADSKRSVGYYPFLQNEAVTSDVIAPSTWKIFGCQNGKAYIRNLTFKGYCIYALKLIANSGLRLFKEAKDWDSRGRHWDDHPAIMAVGVVNGTPEAIFRALMSLGASRSEGSVVEHLDGHTDIIHKKLYSNWLPWGMRRRDLLLRRYWRREEDEHMVTSHRFLILYHSVIHKKCPPQKGYVRACLKSNVCFAFGNLNSEEGLYGLARVAWRRKCSKTLRKNSSKGPSLFFTLQLGYSTFLIRGENYLKDNQKIRAEGSLMQMVGADWLRSDHREDDLGSRPESIIQKYAAQGRPEFFFVINMQIPGATQYTLAVYYMLKTPLEETPLLHSFVHGDDAFRNSRFKLIPYISKGSWIVKQSVGKKACIVGQALQMQCFRGKNYLELDIDVGSSTVARGVASLVLGYLNNLVIEMAFVIQVTHINLCIFFEVLCSSYYIV
ncbi:hypothetical protein DKX38_016489 [Salix brachista]|uniref:Dolichyl-diphosphooligosaccharide--protein glycosyltransferase subunit 1 n=1 Tax=Salix brachista TaxID=2182728 RepID=A0A5N5L9W0_9ROSI|nr:hypothetical protein DKX38_016489 [Salix brachista]